MKKKILITLLIILIGILAKVSLTAMKKEEHKKKFEPKIKSIEASVVTLKNQTPIILKQGHVKALNRVNFVAEVSGKVAFDSFKLRAGNTFNKGDVLLSINSIQAQNNYAISMSNLLNGLSQVLPEIKVNYPSSFDSWNSFFLNCSDHTLPKLPTVSNSREKLFLSAQNIFTLYYSAKSQKDLLDKHTLRAPFTGTVAQATINPGNMASPGMPLATLVETGTYEIEISLSSSEVRLLTVNTPVTLTIEQTNSRLTGKIGRISPVIDQSSQSYLAYVTLRNHHLSQVSDGTYATVSIASSKIPHSFTLPRSALYKSTNVLKINKGALEISPVTITYLDHQFAYITQGIVNGDTLITVPFQGAINGSKIKPILEQ